MHIGRKVVQPRLSDDQKLDLRLLTGQKPSGCVHTWLLVSNVGEVALKLARRHCEGKVVPVHGICLDPTQHETNRMHQSYLVQHLKWNKPNELHV